MEKIEIYFHNDVIQIFNELVFDLYTKNYFSSLSNSIEYKENIISFIKNSINTFPHKKSPKKLKNFGNSYIFYTSNHRTTWYIFFEKYENYFLITQIFNNHSSYAKYII